MGIRDVPGRSRAGSRTAHRRAFTALEGIEEHLRFSQVFTCLDDSPLSILVGLTGLSLSVIHSAPPRSPRFSEACRHSSACVFRRRHFTRTAS